MIRSRLFSAGLLPLFILWFVWSTGLAGATAPTDSQGTKRALLIGINISLKKAEGVGFRPTYL